jgi:DnaK suppressor protein
MRDEDLAKFAELLKSWLAELEGRAGQTVSGLFAAFNDRPSDLLDRASTDSDQNLTFRIRDRETKLIRKIKAALQAIDKGEYGICEMCGQEISLARLTVRPVTSYCIQCKTRMEAVERTHPSLARNIRFLSGKKPQGRSQRWK